MRQVHRLPLFAFVLATASLFGGCSESHRLPTEPEPVAVSQASVASENVAGERTPLVDRASREPGARLQARAAQDGPGPTLAEAKGGNGKGGGGNGNGNGNGGNGNGNGGNGNGGNGGGNGGNGGGNEGGGKPRDLSADIQPDTWNTNWENSEGTVSVVIRGSGLDKIDADSIVLVGSGGELEPQRVQASKNQIRAFFAKGDALDLLDTPERGETHELKIEFTAGDETKSLSLRVRVVGPGGGADDGGEEEDFEALVQPDTWNTNWAGSAGTVSVKITGDGLGDVDLDSIVLVGTDPAAAPLPALRASRNGNHIRAFFSKSDAIETLDTPKAGERHEIIIRLSVDGAETELKETIRIVGPGR
ncbi:MAG TPA: hypothetical protein VN493_06355 [Thermoanaerobaculia bacterium]|nr:hypothetical protein [Thermoanaerobaculia bacterium]